MGSNKAIKIKKMKSIKLIILLLLSTYILQAQNNFYYYKGEKISLMLSTKKIMVKFKEGLAFEKKRNIIASNFSLEPLEKSKSETTSAI